MVLLAMIGLVAGGTASDFAEPPLLDPEMITWRNLTFNAGSFLGKVDTRISITPMPVGKASTDFLAAPGNDAVHATGPVVFSTRIKTSINPLVGFDEVLTPRAWIDCATAAALQRIRLREGKEKWQKSYRYTDAGVFRIRKKPKDTEEADQPALKWTKVKESFYAYRTDLQGCKTVIEPSSLFLVASVIRQIKQDLPFQLCVFNKKQLHLVKVSVNGHQQLKVDYLEKSGNQKKRIVDRINTVKISFHPFSPGLENKAPENFSFLGLKGNFDIFIDQESSLPVQVSGKITAFGRIDLRLERVEFAPNYR